MTDKLKYTCLFGGGAIRGITYIGVIRALEELDIEFDIIGGSSVGAIFATLLACGYKSYELENIFLKVNFDLFKDLHFGFNKPLALSKGEIFIHWLDSLIAKKCSIPSVKDVTFKNLNKDLVIITTDLTDFKAQEFSRIKTPDFKIADAIKISSSMPGFMAPYDYNGNNLVDGDLQKACPMWKLSQTLNYSQSRILEFRLEGDCRNSNIGMNPISYINTIYSCVTDIATNFVQELYGQNDKYDCVKIETGSMFFADLNLGKEERLKLIESGYEQTINYFKNILPKKKEKILALYTDLYTDLKHIEVGLDSNDVDETKLWLGEIFTAMFENKEIIDEDLYTSVVQLKNVINANIKSFLILYNRFSQRDLLEIEMKNVKDKFEQKITELKFYLNKI